MILCATTLYVVPFSSAHIFTASFAIQLDEQTFNSEVLNGVS